MTNHTGPFLVFKNDEGYGDIIPLKAEERYTLGRANTNRIVVKDELCSREHAEVFFAEGQWLLHDLKSLNGTRINGMPLDQDYELSSGNAVQLGRSELIFVHRLEELPGQTSENKVDPDTIAGDTTIAIKKRLGQTRFLTPPPATSSASEESTIPENVIARAISRDLALLYRLALDMASAASYEELVRIVLDGLLEAVPAEVGAILTMTEDRDLQVTAYRHRDPSIRDYAPCRDSSPAKSWPAGKQSWPRTFPAIVISASVRASQAWPSPASSALRSSSATRYLA